MAMEWYVMFRAYIDPLVSTVTKLNVTCSVWSFKEYLLCRFSSDGMKNENTPAEMSVLRVVTGQGCCNIMERNMLVNRQILSAAARWGPVE